MKAPDRPFYFKSQQEWRDWLEENHASQIEAWVEINRNHITRPGILYEGAVEEALCFGWIDGVMKSVGTEFYYLRFSPRKQGSVWSVSNQKRVERLIAQGRMTEAGMAKVREAVESGEWEAAILREDTSRIPEDLREALDENAEALSNYEKLPASQKKQFLYWIASAKSEPTRQKRIQKIIQLVTQDKIDT